MPADDPVTRALNDARALLDTLMASGWQEIHVASETTDIFIARVSGRENPMRRHAEPEPVSPVPAASGRDVSVTAQHVSTLVNALSVGSLVEVGQAVATIRVLDEEEPIVAPVAGRITASAFAPGALIEFGATILTILEQA